MTIEQLKQQAKDDKSLNIKDIDNSYLEILNNDNKTIELITYKDEHIGIEINNGPEIYLSRQQLEYITEWIKYSLNK